MRPRLASPRPANGKASLVPVLLLALALAGCLRVGPGEDLHLVCERESTSPWHPYSPAELEQLTRVEGETTPAQTERLLTDVAHRLLTQRGRPYEAFDARLHPIGNGVWRFDANATLDNATDTYGIELPPLNDTVFVPSILLARAHAIARGGSEIQGPATTVGRATWDRELPGCVRLDYADGTTVWANVDKGQVVHRAT